MVCASKSHDDDTIMCAMWETTSHTHLEWPAQSGVAFSQKCFISMFILCASRSQDGVCQTTHRWSMSLMGGTLPNNITHYESDDLN